MNGGVYSVVALAADTGRTASAMSSANTVPALIKSVLCDLMDSSLVSYLKLPEIGAAGV
jgi:hypothetical protein